MRGNLKGKKDNKKNKNTSLFSHSPTPTLLYPLSPQTPPYPHPLFGTTHPLSSTSSSGASSPPDAGTAAIFTISFSSSIFWTFEIWFHTLLSLKQTINAPLSSFFFFSPLKQSNLEIERIKKTHMEKRKRKRKSK